MALVRASSLDLFLSCSGYLHLPLAPSTYSASKPAAEWGTMVHTWKETAKIVHENRRTATSFKKRLNTLKICHEDFYGSGLHEVSVAWNIEYGYVVPFYGKSKEAEEWKKQFDLRWITGTVDYCESLEYGREATQGCPEIPAGLWVDDLKTGKWWTKTPRQSAQIVFYGMCMSKLYNSSVSLSVTHWPRYPATGRPKRTVETVSMEEMQKFEDKLRRACEESVNPKYNPTEDGCRFCPARNSCLFAWEYNETY